MVFHLSFQPSFGPALARRHTSSALEPRRVAARRPQSRTSARSCILGRSSNQRRPRTRSGCDRCDLGNASDAKVKTIAESTVPKLRDAAAALETAEADFQTACKAWREAEDLEDLRLGEHRRAMDSLLGELRKLFPGDRAIQNLIVDDGDERGDGGAGPGPTPGPTPA